MAISITAAYSITLIFLLYLLNERKITGFFIRNQKFNCTRCVNCCKLRVTLTPEDINSIKKAGYKEDFFIENKKKEKRLKRNNDYCIFLQVDEGNSKCKIYNNRPETCRNFPKIDTFFKKRGNDSRCSSFKRFRLF